METRPTPHGKNLRIGRVSLPNQIYLVTVTTKSRMKVFDDFSAASIASKFLYDNHITSRAKTLCFVIMPNHLHWLLQLGETSTLAETVRLYKSKVTVTLGRSIWQDGFHDHALRKDEDVINVARYVVANPLRAGLCGKLSNYPFWNAEWL